MHDIALLLVRFGKLLKIVFSTLKYDHLVQNGRFSGQNLLQICKFRKIRPSYDTLKFLLIKFRLVNFNNHFCTLKQIRKCVN